MIPYEWLEQAENRIAPYIRHTPLTYDAARNLFIKWENQQLTGSFKARGAFNKMLVLQDWERQVGIVAASAGNHGQGVAVAGLEIGARVEVFVGESAVPAKVDSMRSLGAMIHVIPGGYPEAEAAGKAYAEEHGKTWISPYNDGQVIAGQGTVGLELMRELKKDVPVWLVPVSGGGLLAGIGASIRGQAQRPHLIGVQAEVAPFMRGLFRNDTQDGIPDLPSLADGLTGAVEKDSVTIPIIKQLVDEIILVSEEEIAQAMAFAWYVYHEEVEGAGVVGLAAILSEKVKSRPAVVIVSGGNVDVNTRKEITTRYAQERWI